MRIALVSHEYPPFHGGGIGTYTTVMSELLVRAGHEVHVLTRRVDQTTGNPAYDEPLWHEGNLWVHRLDVISDDWQRPKPPHTHDHDLYAQIHRDWSPYLYYAEKVAQAMERICREHQIEVAEFPECAAEGYGVIRRKRHRLGFTDLPITVTLHSPIYEIYQYNLYSRHNAGFRARTEMEEYCIRHADTVNSPTRLLAKIVYERLGLAADDPPCAVIPLPMDFASIEQYIPQDAPGPRSDAAPSLLFVGRLEPRKGVRYLVDAAVRVMQRHPDLTVTLVGRDCDAGEVPGSMTQFLLSRIPSRLRPQFRFLGQMPRQDLFALYGQATACVFAAPWDNFPLTCCEAMTSGGCVIGSDYTGMADMIEHGKSGLLFKSRDIDSLASCIEQAITDPALVARIRQEAPRRIRQFCDPQQAVVDRIAHYERTIERQPQRAARRSVSSGGAGRSVVALLVPALGEPDAVHESIASAQAAARFAGVDLDITVCVRGEAAAGGAWSDDDGMPVGTIGADWQWIEQLRHRPVPADYIIRLHPGETLQETFLAVTTSQLAQNDRFGWIATWALPRNGQVGAAYAGFDFTVPMGVLDYQPVPIALIRHKALTEVGGWNSELPHGWAAWDLWLAMQNAGWEGIVLPLWLARYQPRRDYLLTPPGHHQTFVHLLESVVQRSPRAFAQRAVDIWLDRLTNSVYTAPLPPTTSRPESAPPVMDAWALIAAHLVRRYPRLASVYRRIRFW